MNKLYWLLLSLVIATSAVFYKFSMDDKSIPESISSISETNIPTLSEQKIFVDSQSTIPPTKIDDTEPVDPAPVDLSKSVRNARAEAIEPAINKERSEEDGSIRPKVKSSLEDFLQKFGAAFAALDFEFGETFEQDERPISDKASALYDRMYSELNQAEFQNELQSLGYTISGIDCKSSACRIQVRSIENVAMLDAEGEVIDELHVDDLVYDTLSPLGITAGMLFMVDANNSLLIYFKLPEDGDE